MSVAALAMLLVFGAPTFAAMTPTLWALFALGQVGNLKTYVKVGKTVVKLTKAEIAFLNSPAFRTMAAANGEAAIKWQNRQMEY